MTDQEKHLSLAIDALTELRELLVGLELIAPTSRVVRRADEALKHLEAAANMPKPSRIRSLGNRLRKAA